MKLASLFDGSGGFGLAGAMCGIKPVWASEIEPYPIAVTTSRFKDVKHMGSVTDINGGEVEPVDIITFGSPCQDLSIAGKRAGLKHEANGDGETTRSGLFMEAVRIIKEMREKTNGKYPTFAVWENVPGAFSSNKGEDFRIVLEELVKIAEPTAVMPGVPKGGWAYADYYCGDGWSIAYRVFDAQYWGVPQRRKRIYLVLDLGGRRAKEILFERKGLRGYFAEGRTPWKEVAGYAENGVGADDSSGDVICFEPGAASRLGGYCYDNKCGTLRATMGDNQFATAYTMKIRSGCAGGGKGPLVQEDKSATLSASGEPQTLFQPVVAVDQGGGKSKCAVTEGVSPTLCATHDGSPAVAYSVENHPADSRVDIDDSGKVQTLTSRMGTGGGNVPLVMEPIVSIDGDKMGKAERDGGSGMGVSEKDAMYTLTAKDRHSVCYGISSYDSNAMKSSNPNSGVYEADTSRCLDLNGGNPGCNQGGIAIVECLETFHCTTEADKSQPLKARDWKDPMCVAYGIDRVAFNQGANAKYDFSIAEEQQPTLTAVGPGACCYWDGSDAAGTLTANNAGGNQRMPDKDNFNCVIQLASGDDKTGCLMASGYTKLGAQEMFSGDYTVVEKQRMRYIVRRLTPTECARLQGFPDRWGDIDQKEYFSDDDYRFWLKVRQTHEIITKGTTKEYTKVQMLTYYNRLHSDSAEYKMWGNGIALPCALYVMQGIKDAEEAKE